MQVHMPNGNFSCPVTLAPIKIKAPMATFPAHSLLHPSKSKLSWKSQCCFLTHCLARLRLKLHARLCLSLLMLLIGPQHQFQLLCSLLHAPNRRTMQLLPSRLRVPLPHLHVILVQRPAVKAAAAAAAAAAVAVAAAAAAVAAAVAVT